MMFPLLLDTCAGPFAKRMAPTTALFLYVGGLCSHEVCIVNYDNFCPVLSHLPESVYIALSRFRNRLEWTWSCLIACLVLCWIHVFSKGELICTVAVSLTCPWWRPVTPFPTEGFLCSILQPVTVWFFRPLPWSQESGYSDLSKSVIKIHFEDFFTIITINSNSSLFGYTEVRRLALFALTSCPALTKSIISHRIFSLRLSVVLITFLFF